MPAYKTIPNFKPELLQPYTAKMVDWHYDFGEKVLDLETKEIQLTVKGRGIDCSGYIDLMMWKICKFSFPDGSWNQGDYLRRNGYKKSTVAAGKLKDGIVRIAVLPKIGGNPGHIVFILNGMTYESSPSTGGPGSRPWTGTGWQAACDVWVVA